MPFPGPPQIIEVFKSGGGKESLSEPTAVKIYVVMNTDDDVVVRQLVETTAPTFYLGLTLIDYDFRPIGNGLWDVTATWGTEKLSNLGEVVTSFDTTGGNRHFKQSLQTMGAYGAPGWTVSVNDFGGAIGVESGRVQGVDFPGPATFTFQITKSWPVPIFNQTKIVAIANATFKVNTDLFYGFAPGTLLFLGASGGQRGLKDWEVTYQFGFNRNQTNLTIGTITGVNHKGWEYVWCQYVDQEEDSNTRMVKRPVAAYVERLAELEVFSSLGV